MIELKDNKKIYKLNNLEVLKGINLQFSDLGFSCALGPSGCGKTTLLNIIGYGYNSILTHNNKKAFEELKKIFDFDYCSHIIFRLFASGSNLLPTTDRFF